MAFPENLLSVDAIVEFEKKKKKADSIIRFGRPRSGVKTLLWITEYITKSVFIHYDRNKLIHCLSYRMTKFHIYC